MADFVELVGFFHDGSFVKRFHTVRTLTEQTVGQHSFGVAMLCLALTENRASAKLLIAALSHDLAEQHVGDVPAPFKRAHEEVKLRYDQEETRRLHENGLNFPMTEDEKRILKLADAMEGMLFCCHEAELGNRSIAPVFFNFRDYASEHLVTKNEHDIFISITHRWSES